MSSTSQATSPLEALKAGFRRACVRRLVGDEQGAIQILRDEIPIEQQELVKNYFVNLATN